MHRVAKEAYFSASHHLRNYGGKCENIHGHNWKVTLVAEGERLNDGGMLIDFAELKRALKEVLSRLDHHDLNTVPPFDEIEPSAENIARHICEEAAKIIDRDGVRVAEVQVAETNTSTATYISEGR